MEILIKKLETMKQYKWKETWGGFRPTVPVEAAITVFETVENTYGKLTAKNLLKYSENPKSPLHTMFEWDDSVAATRYRIEQAGKIINNVQITIVSDGKPREVGAYEVVRTDDGNCYKDISCFTVAEVDRVKEQTKTAINQLINKLRVFQKFNKIVFELEQVQEKLESA